MVLLIIDLNMNNLLKLCIGIAVLAFLAVTIFKIPLGNILPYGVLLLCPLMHLFMMNHGNHSEKSTEDHSKHESYERNNQTIHS